MTGSFYFYDFETYGTDPRRDWPAQFAGIRTDTDFNEIDKPLELFCRLPEDQIPNPEACLVTGLTPDIVNPKGLCEAEFIRRINDEFSQPSTCVLGYNSLRFDDEVVRNSLYRNFFDPYAREWKNGNSRWDLLDVARLCAALRPEGIVWPRRDDGYISFRLDQLTVANGISHADAHDAVADVRATIAMAKLLKQSQPQLFEYVMAHRLKWQIAKLLDLHRRVPVVHVSGMYSAERGCLAIVAPLVQHPTNKNGVVVYDLAVDPEPLLSLSEEEISHRLFTSRVELEKEGVERIALKTIHINKAPVVVPWKALRDENKERLGIDQIQCKKNYQKLFDEPALLSAVQEKIMRIFTGESTVKPNDPDHMIYTGGFFSDADKEQMARIRMTEPSALGDLQLAFKDGRMEEMLFRYQARNWPETLDQEQRDQWIEHCRKRLLAENGGGSICYDDFASQLKQLRDREDDESRLNVLLRLENYMRERLQVLG